MPLAALFLCVFQQDDTQYLPPPRLQVLFLGDRGHHEPAARLQEIYGALARRGVAVDYEDDLLAVTPELLARYDAVAVYANFPAYAAMPAPFAAALTSFVAESGHGLVALHCASACFPESPEWTRLIGARFDRHGVEEFTDRIVAPDHPVMSGWPPLTSWDETYVHRDHQPQGRTVLALRQDEPYTWVRNEGKGRVFYTAWGHDSRTWTQPGFVDLVARGLLWAAGERAAARVASFALPELAYEARPTVPNY